jgi:hypothetical protein
MSLLEKEGRIAGTNESGWRKQEIHEKEKIFSLRTANPLRTATGLYFHGSIGSKIKSNAVVLY